MKTEIGFLSLIELPTVAVASLTQTQPIEIWWIQTRRHEHAPRLFEADQAAIEQPIDVRGEQQAVGAVKAFDRCTADAPRLDMARDEQCWVLNSCQTACAFDLGYARPEQPLSLARENQLSLSRRVQTRIGDQRSLDRVVDGPEHIGGGFGTRGHVRDFAASLDQ